MDLCGVLLVLSIVLFIVTIVGHGVWLFFALLFRAILGDSSPRRDEARPTPPVCPGCGWPRTDPLRCLQCGVSEQTLAEVGELEIAERQVKRLAAEDGLDATFVYALSLAAAKRKRKLLRQQPEALPDVLPVVVETAPSPVVRLSPVQRLEAILGAAATIDDLSGEQRDEALACHREAHKVDLAPLPALCQRNLAALLTAAAESADALRAYRRLLMRYPQAPEYAADALRAARLAEREHVLDQAEWFFTRAMTAGTLAPAECAEAEEFLRSLREEQEAIPVVVAVEEQAPAVIAVAEPAPSAPRFTPPPARPLALPREPEPPPPPPPPAPEPRRSFGEMLAGFMEEKNILWGEILGGLLIVGCSIALVISLWSQVEKIPYFPFVIFGTITAALLGAGLYTLHHWKLESTSRGLLVIGTLLVPLNFLVMAGLHREASAGGLAIELGVAGVFLALFVALLGGAGRVLLPEQRWLLAVGVLATSVTQLPSAALTDSVAQLPAGLFLLLGGLPLAIHAASASLVLRRIAHAPELEAMSARTVLGFLGLTTFALAVALGFVAFRTNDLPEALHRLAPLTVLAAVPLLVGGLTVQRRLGAGDVGLVRLASTATALAGMAGMVAAVALAWPHPVALLVVCLLNFALLTAAAFRWDMPAAHAVALPCLALAYLVGFHGLLGDWPVPAGGFALLQVLAQANSGTALAVLVVALGLGSWLVTPLGWRQHGAAWAAGSGVLAVVSLAAVTWQGGADPVRATIIYGLYGAGALALNLHWRKPLASHVGLGLLTCAALWALSWQAPHDWPVWSALLATTALLAAALRAPGARSEEQEEPASFPLPAFLAAPLGAWAIIVLVLAVAFGGWAAARGPGWWGEATALHAWTSAALAATAFLLAWGYRQSAWTWIGSGFVLLGLVQLLGWDAESHRMARVDFTLALLAHATLLGIAGVLASGARQPPEGEQTSEDSTALRGLTPPARLILAEPCWQSALATSLLAAPFLAFPQAGHMTGFALNVAWLSAIWLVVAWAWRSPALFAAFQSGLGVAVLYGVTSWLEGQDWVAAVGMHGLLDPRSLQAYGIGLAVLCGAWLGVQAIGRRWPRWQELADETPVLERMLPAALVVTQLFLALGGIAPAVARELTAFPARPILTVAPADSMHAYGPGAWALLGALAAGAVLALWQQPAWRAVLRLTLLAVTVPVLIAGRFETTTATAAALRWCLAACFLIFATLLWARRPLASAARAVGIDEVADWDFPRWLRGLLIPLCVMPILLLTTWHMSIRFSGLYTVRPAAGTFFGGLPSYIIQGVPMLLLAVALVGHALREKSAGYAFAAGLVVDAVAMGGYALYRREVLGGDFGVPARVTVLQIGSLTAALWALAWLATRRWVFAWREDSVQLTRRLLMSVQIALVLLGNAVLLLGGVVALAGTFPDAVPDLAQAAYPVAPWAAAAGSWLGWLTLAMGVGAVIVRERQRGDFPNPLTLGWAALAVAILLACSIDGWAAPGWGYRSLMLGGAVAALVAVGVPSALARRDAAAAGGPVIVAVVSAGALAVLLGMKAAIWHNDHLWGAGAILLASVAVAAAAVWRREEGLAFSAGLGLNLAASLVIWHYQRGAPFADWWYYLLQANGAATGAAALLWLGARKRFYGDQELRLQSAPLLLTQIVLGILSNVPTLALACLLLFLDPALNWATTNTVVDFGKAGGWLALLLPMAASLWYTTQATPHSRLPVLVLFGLGLSAVAACTACQWDAGNWLAFHVLLVGWSTTGLLVLGLGLATDALHLAAADESILARLTNFPHAQIQRWVTFIGCLVVVLALRGAGSTAGGSFWSPAAALTVAVMAVGMGLWTRRAIYVYQSGLLFNLVGNLALMAYGVPSFGTFAAVNILCLAFGAAFWSGLELALRFNALAFSVRSRTLPFDQLALGLALAGMTGLTALGLAGVPLALALTWGALAVLLAAVVIRLAEPEAPLSTAGLYLLGMHALVLVLVMLDLPRHAFPSAAVLGLSGYVLLATIAARGASAWLERPLAGWFVPVQTAAGLVVIVVGTMLALQIEWPGYQVHGPLALALLLPAAVLLAHDRPDSKLRAATLALAGLVLVTFGWALLPADLPAPWLHRAVVLLAGLAALAASCATGSRWPLPAWSDAAQRLAPIAGAGAIGALLVVLVQEAMFYDAMLKQTPLAPWAAVVVIGGLLTLVVAGIGCALAPERDPLRLSDEWRTAYVYAAEVLLFLLFVHIKLTLPWLLNPRLGKYWTFIVMAIAFAGVGLGELFHRLRLPVLATPLRRTGVFLPLLPVLAFWVQEPAAGLGRIARFNLPGAAPLLHYLEMLPRAFDNYALIWLLCCFLYSLVALSRRSVRFAAAAALAGNFALWSFWQHTGMSFLVHPQLWLIPLALVLLTAEHLNRDRLTAAQTRALRYIGLGLLYLSSTADMFIAGLGNSVWLPLFLMLLSVGGVLLGILFRIRAYLFLGTAFAFLVVFSMIWHAAVDLAHTWVWWASGIVLGVLILTLFAVFEKRRNDVLLMLEQIKQWR